jgi:hypothetical protein
MKKLFFFSILALLFLGMYSCQKDQIEPLTEAYETQESATTRANATVPFHGEYDVAVEFLSEPGELPVLASLDAEGKARHLGKSTWISELTIIDLVFPPDAPPFLKQTGDMTFTAADGSQLIGSFEGEYFPTVEEDGVVVDAGGGSGTYIIESGTGRFEGAKTPENCEECTYFWENRTALGELFNYLEFNGTLTNP